MAAEEIGRLVKDVHGAAFAFGNTRSLGEKFCHHGPGISTQPKRMSMIAVGGDPFVVFGERTDGPRSTRLLADVEMTKAADLLQPVKLSRLFLKLPHELHALVPEQVCLF